MAENNEVHKQIPLTEMTQPSTPKDVVVDVIPTRVAPLGEDTVLSQQNKDISPEVSSPSNLTPEEAKELAALREKIDIMADQGLATGNESKRIKELATKEQGYSLVERRFAPGSILIKDLDPLWMTPDGRPVYAYIPDIANSGVLMELPKDMEKRAKFNERLARDIERYGNLVKRPEDKNKKK